MTVIFISDLHLSPEAPEMVQLFCQLLTECQQGANALYILGDFFDAWAGDDLMDDMATPVVSALRSAVDSGLPVALQHGNRDFLLGKRFLTASGCCLLPDEYLFTLCGQSVLLMHGDTLCTQDLAYQRFRRWSRNFFAKKIFLLQSKTKRLATVAYSRTKSRAHTANTPASLMDVTEEAVASVMRKHNTKWLIHGHTHRPAEHVFCLDGQPALRTVLPAWHEKAGALVCQPDGSRQTVTVLPGSGETFLGGSDDSGQ